MNIINIVSKVALAGLVAGEKEKVLKFDDFSLGLQKDNAYHLSNALIALPASGYNGIKLPTLYGSSLNMSASDCANVIVSCIPPRPTAPITYQSFSCSA